ncbi:MAG: hypothetical protein IH984_06855 [Planctomycetes bacterium]|nr:hypothetical protein [Planctomycetota bacterium]
MTTVAAFVSSSTPPEVSGAQTPPTQAFMAIDKSPDPDPGTRGTASDLYNEKYCLQLTGLSIQETSISVGKYLNIYWHSILEVDPLLRAALLPIKSCTPDRLKQCMNALIQRYPDPRGMHRWMKRHMRQLVPLLDWKIVLAYARFNDPAIAEEAIKS